MGKYRAILVSGIFFLGLVLGIWLTLHFQKTSSTQKKLPEFNQEATTSGFVAGTSFERGFVSRVIDGDTIALKDGRKIRYIGIDTPETVDPRKSIGCFGFEASQRNRELVLNREVELEKDVSDTDRFGRLLRYVYVKSEETGRIMVNEMLVKDGFALSSTFPPDVKHQDRFIIAEKQAQNANIGLWGSCQKKTGPIINSTESVSLKNNEFETRSDGLTSASGCVIKGNISTASEKIYHLPGCGSYEKTVIDESAGERWFCSEDEAVKAGFRKAKNC